MTEIIKFEDWKKLELKVGEVKKVNKKIVVNLGERDFEINLDLDVKIGDKIVVGFLGDSLMVPVVNGNVFLIPEKDAKAGWRVS